MAPNFTEVICGLSSVHEPVPYSQALKGLHGTASSLGRRHFIYGARRRRKLWRRASPLKSRRFVLLSVYRSYCISTGGIPYLLKGSEAPTYRHTDEEPKLNPSATNTHTTKLNP